MSNTNYDDLVRIAGAVETTGKSKENVKVKRIAIVENNLNSVTSKIDAIETETEVLSKQISNESSKDALATSESDCKDLYKRLLNMHTFVRSTCVSVDEVSVDDTLPYVARQNLKTEAIKVLGAFAKGMDALKNLQEKANKLYVENIENVDEEIKNADENKENIEEIMEDIDEIIGNADKKMGNTDVRMENLDKNMKNMDVHDENLDEYLTNTPNRFVIWCQNVKELDAWLTQQTSKHEHMSILYGSELKEINTLNKQLIKEIGEKWKTYQTLTHEWNSGLCEEVHDDKYAAVLVDLPTKFTTLNGIVTDIKTKVSGMLNQKKGEDKLLEKLMNWKAYINRIEKEINAVTSDDPEKYHIELEKILKDLNERESAVEKFLKSSKTTLMKNSYDQTSVKEFQGKLMKFCNEWDLVKVTCNDKITSIEREAEILFTQKEKEREIIETLKRWEKLLMDYRLKLDAFDRDENASFHARVKDIKGLENLIVEVKDHDDRVKEFENNSSVFLDSLHNENIPKLNVQLQSFFDQWISFKDRCGLVLYSQHEKLLECEGNLMHNWKSNLKETELWLDNIIKEIDIICSCDISCDNCDDYSTKLYEIQDTMNDEATLMEECINLGIKLIESDQLLLDENKESIRDGISSFQEKRTYLSERLLLAKSKIEEVQHQSQLEELENWTKNLQGYTLKLNACDIDVKSQLQAMPIIIQNIENLIGELIEQNTNVEKFEMDTKTLVETLQNINTSLLNDESKLFSKQWNELQEQSGLVLSKLKFHYGNKEIEIISTDGISCDNCHDYSVKLYEIQDEINDEAPSVKDSIELSCDFVEGEQSLPNETKESINNDVNSFQETFTYLNKELLLVQTKTEEAQQKYQSQELEKLNENLQGYTSILNSCDIDVKSHLRAMPVIIQNLEDLITELSEQNTNVEKFEMDTKPLVETLQNVNTSLLTEDSKSFSKKWEELRERSVLVLSRLKLHYEILLTNEEKLMDEWKSNRTATEQWLGNVSKEIEVFSTDDISSDNYDGFLAKLYDLENRINDEAVLVRDTINLGIELVEDDQLLLNENRESISDDVSLFQEKTMYLKEELLMAKSKTEEVQHKHQLQELEHWTKSLQGYTLKLNSCDTEVKHQLEAMPIIIQNLEDLIGELNEQNISVEKFEFHTKTLVETLQNINTSLLNEDSKSCSKQWEELQNRSGVILSRLKFHYDKLLKGEEKTMCEWKRNRSVTELWLENMINEIEVISAGDISSDNCDDLSAKLYELQNMINDEGSLVKGSIKHGTILAEGNQLLLYENKESNVKSFQENMRNLHEKLLLVQTKMKVHDLQRVMEENEKQKQISLLQKDNDVTKKNDEILVMKEQLNEWSEKESKLKSRIQKIISEKEASDKKFSECQQQLEQEKAKRTEIITQHTKQLKEKQEEFNEQIAKVKRTSQTNVYAAQDQLRKKTNELNETVEKHKEEMDAKVKESTQFMQSEHAKASRKLEVKISDMKKNIKELRQKLSEKEGKCTELESTLLDAKTEVDQAKVLNTSLVESEQKVGQLSCDMEAMNDELSDWKKKYENLHVKYADLSEELDIERRKCLEILNDRDKISLEMQEIVANVKEEEGTLQNELNNLKTKFSYVEDESKELTQQLHNKMGEIDILVKKLDTVNKELNVKDSNYSNKCCEYEKLKEQCDALSREKVQLESDHKESVCALEEAHNLSESKIRNEYEAKIQEKDEALRDQLNKVLSDKDSSVEVVTKKLEEMRKQEIQEMEGRHELQLNELHDDLKMKIDNVETKHQNYMKQHQEEKLKLLSEKDGIIEKLEKDLVSFKELESSLCEYKEKEKELRTQIAEIISKHKGDTEELETRYTEQIRNMNENNERTINEYKVQLETSDTKRGEYLTDLNNKHTEDKNLLLKQLEDLSYNLSEMKVLCDQKEKELGENKLLYDEKEKELNENKLLCDQKDKELSETKILCDRKEEELCETRIICDEKDKELCEQKILCDQKDKELCEKKLLCDQKDKEYTLLYEERKKEVEGLVQSGKDTLQTKLEEQEKVWKDKQQNLERKFKKIISERDKKNKGFVEELEQKHSEELKSLQDIVALKEMETVSQTKEHEDQVDSLKLKIEEGNTRLSEHIERYEGDLDSLRLRENDAWSQLEQSKTETMNIKERYENEIAKLESKTIEDKQIIEELNVKLMSGESTTKEIDAKFTEMLLEKSQLEQKISNDQHMFEDRIRQLESEMDNHKTAYEENIRKLEDQLSEEAKSFEKQKCELLDKQSENDESSNNKLLDLKKKAEIKISKLKKENSELVNDFESTKLELLDKITVLETRLEEEQFNHDKDMLDSKEYENKLSTSLEEYEESIRSTSEKFEAEILSLKDELLVKSEKLSVLEEQLDSATLDKMDSLKIQKTNLDEEHDALIKKIEADKIKEIELIERKLTAKIDEKDFEHNSEIKAMLKQFQSQLSAKDMEIQQSVQEAIEVSQKDERRIIQEYDDQIMEFQKELHLREKEMVALQIETQNQLDLHNEERELMEKEHCDKFEELEKEYHQRLDDLTKRHEEALAKSTTNMDDAESNMNKHLNEMEGTYALKIQELEDHHRTEVLAQEKKYKTQLKQAKLEIRKLLANQGATITNGGEYDLSGVASNNSSDSEMDQSEVAKLKEKVATMSKELASLREREKCLALQAEQSPSTPKNDRPATLQLSDKLNDSISQPKSPQPLEFEYLRNILYNYMMGKQRKQMAKVLTAIVHFSPSQVQQILAKVEEQESHVEKKSSSWL